MLADRFRPNILTLIMSYTTTTTFTRTHARHLAAKVVADLYECSGLYGSPSEDSLDDYEEELIELLSGGYVATYEFGFKKDGARVLSWRYSVSVDGGLQGGDSQAGRLHARVSIAGATYYNHMSYTEAWSALSEAGRAAVRQRLPFQRTTGALPGDGDGYWQTDHGYSSGGVRIDRTTFRPW